MTTLALALVLASALAHALWNLLAKRSADRLAFLWLMNAAIAALLAPVVLYLLIQTPVTAAGWTYILGTGALHIAYFWSLGRSYADGDLSLVYPIARGTGPLLVTLFAIPLFGELPSSAGLAGITLIVLGVYGAHLPGLGLSTWYWPLRTVLLNEGSRFALLTGLIIACYTLWDRAGVSHVAPFLYGYFVFTLPAAAGTPYVLLRRRSAVRRELSRWWQACLAGILAYTAYGLVLTAFTLSKVSYVAAAREVGIIFGALLGAALLREKHGPMKVAGAAIIFVGVALIAIAG